MKKSLFSLLALSSGECPCREITGDLGSSFLESNHQTEGGFRHYLKVRTNVGETQLEDFAFIISFSSPFSDLKQYFGTSSATDGENTVFITPNQNMISGNPYEFNTDATFPTEDLSATAWFCESSENINEWGLECSTSFNETTAAETTTAEITTLSHMTSNPISTTDVTSSDVITVTTPHVTSAPAGDCPCRKIGEKDFGFVTKNNEHDFEGQTKFYAQVNTPLDVTYDFAYLLKFSQEISQFKQYFATDEFSGSSNFVVITPGQNQISGNPFQFNFEAVAPEEEVEIDAWFCETSDSIEESVKICLDHDDQNSTGAVSSTAAMVPLDDESWAEPEWDHDSHDFSVVKFEKQMNIFEARESCARFDAVLPRPWSQEENEALKNVGSTWLNVAVNEKIDMSYESFMRRQRAFLNAEKEGQWEILHGSVKREFFCVKQPEIGCKNFFKSVDGQKLISAGGDWSIKQNGTFESLEIAENDIFMPQSILKYSCPQKLKNYKPWRKPSKMIQLICVRMPNQDWGFAECNSRNCKNFERKPWMNPKFISSETLSC